MTTQPRYRISTDQLRKISLTQREAPRTEAGARFRAIVNLAHLAWLDPDSVVEVFKQIEKWALEGEALAAAPPEPPRPLSETVVQNALDEAWLESGDARGQSRPPDLAGHLYAALRDYAVLDAPQGQPLDVERIIELARDWKYSDTFIGQVVRSMVPRDYARLAESSEHPETSDER